MALKLVCDGCRCDATEAEVGAAVGRLDPCYYCPECRAAWAAFEAAEEAMRVKLSGAYATWRVKALTKLRKTLTRLPDE